MWWWSGDALVHGHGDMGWGAVNKVLVEVPKTEEMVGQSSWLPHA